MSIPNLVSLAIHTGGFGYDALLYICVATHFIGFVLITAVILHLQRHFVPSPDSLIGQRRPRKRAPHAFEMTELESARPL